MNFNIDLSKMGELPMTNLIIIGVFVLIGLFIWKLPELYRIYVEAKKSDDGHQS